MSTATEHHDHTAQYAKEQAALNHIADRLATHFPDLPAETIVHAIQASFDHFAGSRIRDFIPVLVERSTRAELAGRLERPK